MAEKSCKGRTAAFVAAQEGQVEALRALSELGCPLAEKDNEGRTAAFPAADKGQVEALRALSKLGCPMVQRDKSGFTAAHPAAQGRHLEAFRLLSDLGCRIVMKGKSAEDSMGHRMTQSGEFAGVQGPAVEDVPKGVRREDLSSAERSEGGRALASSSTGAHAMKEEEEVDTVSCVICLDGKATWVFESCGHRCICKACARKQKEKAPGSGAKRRGGKKVVAVVTCPLCRAETRVVPSSRYEGDVFD